MDKQTSLGFAVVTKPTGRLSVLGNQSLTFFVTERMSLLTRFVVKSAKPCQVCHARFGGLWNVPNIVMTINAVFPLTGGSVKTLFCHRALGRSLQCHALVLIDVILSSRHYMLLLLVVVVVLGVFVPSPLLLCSQQ